MPWYSERNDDKAITLEQLIHNGAQASLPDRVNAPDCIDQTLSNRTGTHSA